MLDQPNYVGCWGYNEDRCYVSLSLLVSLICVGESRESDAPHRILSRLDCDKLFAENLSRQVLKAAKFSSSTVEESKIIRNNAVEKATIILNSKK